MFPGGTQWESNYLVFYLYSRFGCSKRRKIHTICVWRATLLSVRLNAPRLCTHSWNRFCMMTNPKRNKRLNISLVGVNQANISLVVLDKWIQWARTMKSHFDQHMEMLESYFRLLAYHVNNRWHNTSQDHFCSVIDKDELGNSSRACKGFRDLLGSLKHWRLLAVRVVANEQVSFWVPIIWLLDSFVAGKSLQLGKNIHFDYILTQADCLIHGWFTSFGY